MMLNCFEREEINFVKEDPNRDEPSRDDALSAVYAVLMPGEPITVEAAEKILWGCSSQP
jgi:DNA-directed RNA polymerase subunit beta